MGEELTERAVVPHPGPCVALGIVGAAGLHRIQFCDSSELARFDVGAELAAALLQSFEAEGTATGRRHGPSLRVPCSARSRSWHGNGTAWGSLCRAHSFG